MRTKQQGPSHHPQAEAAVHGPAPAAATERGGEKSASGVTLPEYAPEAMFRWSQHEHMGMTIQGTESKKLAHALGMRTFLLTANLLGFGFGIRFAFVPTQCVDKCRWIALTVWRLFIALLVCQPAFIDVKCILGDETWWPFWGTQYITLANGEEVPVDAGMSKVQAPVHLLSVFGWLWLVRTYHKMSKIWPDVWKAAKQSKRAGDSSTQSPQASTETTALLEGDDSSGMQQHSFWDVSKDAPNYFTANTVTASLRMTTLSTRGVFARTIMTTRRKVLPVYFLALAFMCFYPLKYSKEIPMCPEFLCGIQTLGNQSSAYVSGLEVCYRLVRSY